MAQVSGTATIGPSRPGRSMLQKSMPRMMASGCNPVL